MSAHGPIWSVLRKTGVAHAFNKPGGRFAYCEAAVRVSERGWRARRGNEVVCLACYRAIRRPTHTLSILGVY